GITSVSLEGCSAKRQGGAMSSIPFENLGTLELAARLATWKRNLVGQVADRELMLVNLAPGRLRRDKHGRRPHVSGGVVQNEIKLVGRKSRRQLDNYGLISPQTAVLALPPVRSQSIAEEEVLPYVLALANSCAAHCDRTVWGWNWSLNGCHPQPRAYPIFRQLGRQCER